jgi:5'-phosphate synthase pdxT subunit
MKIGVLALHGAFIEHIHLLESIGVEAVKVRLPEDLHGLSGLIIPGGESTTMRKLTARWGMREPVMALAEAGAPILGTCAGMIVVADEIAGGEEPVFPLIDVTVARNAFGRQLDSFETDLAMPLVGDRPVHAIFIRAPIIERVGPGVETLARLEDGRVVAVRQRNVIAISFHPELAGETRIHRLVATMAAEFSDPAEGSAAAIHRASPGPRGVDPESRGESI